METTMEGCASISPKSLQACGQSWPVSWLSSALYPTVSDSQSREILAFDVMSQELKVMDVMNNYVLFGNN